MTEARPSFKDAILGVLVFGFAAMAKVRHGDLTWDLTWGNAIEALFPIVAALMVFLSWHTVKAARVLIKELKTESVVEEYNPYPSIVTLEKITATRENGTPLFRVKTLLLASLFIAVFVMFGIFTWKLSAIIKSFNRHEDGPASISIAEPSPSPPVSVGTTPHSLSSPTMPPSPNASVVASVKATPTLSEPPPPKASSLNPYQAFRLHRVVPDVERTYTIRPSVFVKVDVPVRIDAEWLAPEIAGRALVAYVSEVDPALPGRDVAACTTLISRFKEIQKEMAEALKKSNTGESIGVADALILYHGGALTQEQKQQISREAMYRHLEITILGPTK